MGRIVVISMLVLLVCISATAFDNGDFFWAEPDDPLLEAARYEDMFYANEYGRDIRDPNYDLDTVLARYQEFIDARDLTEHQLADVRAHMGMICMYGMEERDTDRARAYFKEALELAGDKILSPDLYMARTNYTALIQDPVEQFEARLDLIDWIQKMDEDAILAALERHRPGHRMMMRRIDRETGEEQLVPMAEDFPKGVIEEPHERTARLLRERMELFMEVQMPHACVQAALLQPNPAEAMERLIERAEGTPIAERAQEKLEYARMLQAAHERTAKERQGLDAPPPSE